MKPTILPPLPATGKRRLRKLIAFLRQLPRHKFDLRLVVSHSNRKKKCGTVCCAIGWTPVVFPSLVEWRCDGHSIQLKNGQTGFPEIGAELFGIGRDVVHSLFNPRTAPMIHMSLSDLPDNATPKQVASMLEKFIKLTETEAK